jgi:ribosomal protein L34
LALDTGLRARLATKTVKKYLPSRKSKGKQHLGGVFQGKKK